VTECTCKNKKSKPGPNLKNDGIIRIRREVKGRRGKTVTTISGFEIDADKLRKLAAQLKRRCGTGGSVKDGIIIIQGDHRETLLLELKKQGFTAKIAGG
jgi:translation initiation factor 1